MWGMTRTNQQAQDGEGGRAQPRDFIEVYTQKYGCGRLGLGHLNHFQELQDMEGVRGGRKRS